MISTKEKIIRILKERISENEHRVALPQFFGMFEEDKRLLEFVESMPDETQSEEDLLRIAMREVTKDRDSALKFLKSAGIVDWKTNQLTAPYRSLPPIDELEEGIQKESNKRYPDISACGTFGTGDYEPEESLQEERDLFEEGARFGAEFQKHLIMKDAISTIIQKDDCQVESSELEEASDDYATRLVNKYTKFGMMDVAAFDGYWLKDAFKDGAKFQKHLMLKDAISTTMQKDDLDDLVPALDDQKEYKVGDKVKVLIFKDDE